MSLGKFPTDHPNKATPRYLDGFFGIFPVADAEGGPAVAVMRGAHANIRDAWSDIFRNHRRRMSDESMMPLARLKSSAGFAKPRLEQAERSFAEAIDRAAKERADIHEALGKHLTHSPQAAEIRTALRSMSAKERVKAIGGAFQNGDREVMQAVAAGPALATGISGDAQGHYRQRFLEAVAPEETAELKLIAEAEETVKLAMDALGKHADAQIDWHSAEKAEQVAA